MSERFTFGIPLVARAVAGDWALVDRLLGLTLRSVLAQTDGDFRVLLAAHDEPASWGRVARDPRFELLRADWTPEPPNAANDDGGAKKWLIKRRVRELGGGLLMFLDADDWVARDLVATARGAMNPGHVGGIVAHGVALDFATMGAAPFPVPGAGDFPFHGLCGSSTIGRVVPGSADPFEADPHLALGSHHEWEERAREAGRSLARLNTWGAYVVGTTQNHSETNGPFAGWRREVTEAVRRHGAPLDARMARSFGQELADLRAAPARDQHLGSSQPRAI
ncbi:MAG: hypothetical protein AVDCRST_MAG91-2156 [uncultured Sphingomonadaceae bacterium]|uniref:Glycosyltransferase 2-like domain-containing protein n=1 Tax=uncultured Sphingomonadaceae bacterium TaxID=169976 RepID=A0A6J4TE17_9SPHN|nr:MAG: hypothetical protein AVDCRST_MAG91-2156 [uncultured Sphingomonadaceae bacterium]